MKVFFYFVPILAIFLFGIAIYDSENRTIDIMITSDTARTPQVIIKNHAFNVLLADTQEKRAKGLSGTASLRADEGMLFVFPDSGLHGFWMKDMLFSLDILWINADKRVVHIEEGVSPDSYPSVFTPFVPALYVLEVSAGSVKEKNIFIGDKVLFSY